MADADFDVSHYSVKELYKLLGFQEDEEPSQNDIEHSIKNLRENTTDPEVINFFQKVSDRLLRGQGQLDESTNMWQTEYSTPTKDDDQLNLRTNRFQQVHVQDDEDENYVMFRNKLNVSNTKPTTILQGAINPNMTNTITRHINIDSQFRKEIYNKEGFSGAKFSQSTDFVLEFTEHLTNVLSLKLHSISIPTTWYAFSEKLGNTCLEIIDKDADPNANIPAHNHHQLPFCACIKEGNPDYTTLQMWLNDKYGKYLDFVIDMDTFKITIYNKTDKNLRIFFYRPVGFGAYLISPDIGLNNTPCGRVCKKPSFVNHNLGWELGFRIPPDEDTGEVYIDIAKSQHQPYILHKNKASYINGTAIVHLSGPKYFTLVIDDYNQNHLNKGLINILEKEETVPLPTYYNPVKEDYQDKDLLTSKNQINSASQVITDDNDKSLACTELRNSNNAKYPFVRKSINKPRQLTAAQIYSINEILKNRHKVKSRVPPPTLSNTFANITLKNVTSLRANHESINEYGSSLHFNSRTYFGPVHIRKMHVRLHDDKGTLVDLNGHDWSFTIIAEMLYQY